MSSDHEKELDVLKVQEGLIYFPLIHKIAMAHGKPLSIRTISRLPRHC
jgi:hypothetical protein